MVVSGSGGGGGRVQCRNRTMGIGMGEWVAGEGEVVGSGWFSFPPRMADTL